jgi:hypothetical protein
MLQIFRPLIDLSFGFFLRCAILLLYFADELVAFSRCYVNFIVCKFTPLLLRFAFELLPLAGNLIPIHILILRVLIKVATDAANAKSMPAPVGCVLNEMNDNSR